MSAQMGSRDDLLRQGEQALTELRWQDASELFKTAYDTDPSEWRAIQGLSIALFWLGRREDAWVLAQEAYRRAPEDADNAANLREIAEATGHDADLGQIMSNVPATEAVVAPAASSCDLGERFLESEKWNDSVPHFLKAIDEDAGQSRAWGGIGIACYRQGWNNAARAFFEMAVRMDPADADSVFNWVELAPSNSSDRDIAMSLDGMGVERALREKAIEARKP